MTFYRPPSPTGGGFSAVEERIKKGLAGARPRSSGRSAPTGPDSGASPGTYNINLLDPIGTGQEAAAETTNLFVGLQQGLFGADNANRYGQHGGLLGDKPIIGDVGRGITNVVGVAGELAVGAVGAALDFAETDTAGKALAAITPGGTMQRDLNAVANEERFKALPIDSPARLAAEAALLEPGNADRRGHIVTEALKEYEKEKALEHPSLYSGMFVPGPSVTDTIGMALDSMSLLLRPVERIHAGGEDPGNLGRSGLNRAEEIMAFGRGEIESFGTVGGFGADIGKTMTPLEQTVFQKVSDGDWTEDEALDYLTANSSGFSRDPLWEAAASVAYDPLTWASVGMAGAASVGVKATKLAELTTEANKALTAARLTGNAEAIAVAEQGLANVMKAGLRLKGTSARINVFGKLMETERAAGVVRFAGAPYVRLQGTALGRTAKVARSILDPMSAFPGLNPGAVKHMDLLTDETVKRLVDGMGQVEHLQVVQRLADIHPDLADLFVKDFGVYSGNLMRRVVATEHRAAQFEAGLTEELRKVVPDEVVESIISKKAPMEYMDRIMEEGNRLRIRDWNDEAVENLVTRLSKMYKHLDHDEWQAEVKAILGRGGAVGADMLSYLHAATYGYATRRLVDTVAAARKTGISQMGDKLSKLVIINKRTLTKQGANGIIKRLDEAAEEGGGGLVEQFRQVQHEVGLYQTLDFVDLDPSSMAKSVEDFREVVGNLYNSLPTQVEYDELAGMGDDFASFMDEMQGSYNLGFMPDDEYLWGLQRLNKAGGRLMPVSDVWTGHVGTEVGTFNPMRELPHNIIGQALPRTVGKVYKVLDHVDALGRAYKSRVTGTAIAEAAKSRLVHNITKAGAGGFNGMTKKEAEKVAETLLDAVDANSAIVTARGLSTDSMWNIAKGVVPPRLGGKFGPRELMNAVLDAYEGDMRFVGLTQAFTGRVKRMLGKMEGNNRLGQLSEDLYPRLKFHLNPFFQVQEKIEPWVLSVQRGIEPVYGKTMNEADIITEQVLERMTTSSVIRLADVDMYEQGAKVLMGNSLKATASTKDTAMNAALAALKGAGNVQGTKRVAMLRTFRKGLGKELKKAWDEADNVEYEGALQAAKEAGESTADIVKANTWHDMQLAESVRRGALVSDDDFAVQMLSENFLGNDFLLNRVEGLAKRFTPDEFKSALIPGTWAAPQHIGKMSALGLNDMAELLHWPGIKSEGDLRAAIANKTLTVDDVAKALFDHGADLDYVNRVKNALNFSWEGFWQTARRTFNLTDRQSEALQDFVAASAKMHDDMSPLEYISQVFSPGILHGEDGTLGSLGRAVDIIKDGRLVGIRSDLATLVASDGAGYDDLVRQMSAVFSDHLDPSAKVALLREFGADVKRAVAQGDEVITSHAGVEYNLADIDAAWNEQMQEQLAQRILTGIKAEPISSLEELMTRRPGIIGQNIYNQMPPEMQAVVIDELNKFTRDFPDVNLRSVNINHDFHSRPRPDFPEGYPLDSQAATRNFEGNRQTTMHLSPRYFGKDAATREQAWGQAVGRNELAWAVDGAPEVISTTPEGAIRHELGHVLIKHLEERVATRLDEMTPEQMAAAKAVINQVKAIQRRYGASLSRYAGANVDEAGGELFDLAFGPELDFNLYFEKKYAALRADGSVDITMMPGELAKIDAMKTDVQKFRQLVEETHLYQPPAPPPDIERTVQAFGEWANTAVAALIKGSDDPDIGPAMALLEEMGRLNKGAGTVYNATEAHLVRAAMDAMAAKFDDAYRLQYYSRGRTMLERSINHPMFGLYPASYMWGKMLPEMIRFVAATPFGVHTTAMGYALHNVQKTVGAQREFDPEFDAFIERLGHSQSMFALSYLLPASPWDIPATAPAWVRAIAEQGLDQQTRMAKGKPAGEIDVYSAAEKSAEQMSPLRGFKAVNAALDELTETTPEQLAEMAREQAGQATGPVKATELGPTLEESMQQLRDVLSAP